MIAAVWPYFAVVGAVIGSFLNVVADRLPQGASLASPGSHCPQCKRRLGPLELIPVLSYLALRGLCRNCGAAIPLRVVAVEAATAAVFALAAVRYGLGLRAAFVCLFTSLLIAFFVIDLEHSVIPNRLVFPALGLALLAIPFSSWTDPRAVLLGGALSFGVLFLIALVASGGMGMGDVKLAAFLGLILGFPDIVPGLLLAFIAGGAIAGGLLLAGKLRRDDPVPFGPFLASAGIVFLLYGDPIVDWWLRGGGLWS